MCIRDRVPVVLTSRLSSLQVCVVLWQILQVIQSNFQSCLLYTSGVVVAAGAAAGAAAEEKTEFDVELTEAGANKVKVCLLYTSRCV